MSPLYGFTADDAARLRSQSRDVPRVRLPDRAQAETDPRCRQDVREDWSQLPGGGGHHALGRLSQLPVQQDGLSRRWSWPWRTGRTRLANLRLLERNARDYEGSGYHVVWRALCAFLGPAPERNSADLQAAERAPQGRTAPSR